MVRILCFGRSSRLYHEGVYQKLHYGGFSSDGGAYGNREVHSPAVPFPLSAVGVTTESGRCCGLSVSVLCKYHILVTNLYLNKKQFLYLI